MSKTKKLLQTLFYALLCGALMGFALGFGTSFGDKIVDVVNATGMLARLIPALLVASIAFGGVVALARKQRLTLQSIGLTNSRESFDGIKLGVAVNTVVISLVFIPAFLFGWFTVDIRDGSLLLPFLLSNLIVAILLEAFPEEVLVRGYILTCLSKRYKAAAASLLTTGIFLVIPAFSVLIAFLTNLVIAGEGGYLGFVPEGQDPIIYFVLLFIFSTTLIAARRATKSLTIWTSITFHLTFLTVNRLFLGIKESGVDIHLATADVEGLILLYTLLAGMVYWRLGIRQRRASSLT